MIYIPFGIDLIIMIVFSVLVYRLLMWYVYCDNDVQLLKKENNTQDVNIFHVAYPGEL